MFPMVSPKDGFLLEEFHESIRILCTKLALTIIRAHIDQPSFANEEQEFSNKANFLIESERKAMVLMFPSFKDDAFEKEEIIFYDCHFHDISFFKTSLLSLW